MDEYVETLMEDEDGEFWARQCTIKGCQFHTTHDSDLYCYPHSKWYRKYKRYWNILAYRIQMLFSKEQNHE